MLIGMGTLERLHHYVKKGTIVVSSFIFSGIILILLGRVTNVPLATLLIVLLGVGNIYITSSIQTILQNKIPRQLRGRVFGVQNMLINSAFTLPVILFGAIADWVGVLIALSALGWMVLLMGVAGIFLPKFKTV